MGWQTHIRRLLSLGVPLIGSLVAQMVIQATDTLMLGRYDVEVLAGQVLGSTLFVIVMLFGAGFAWAVTPLVSEAEARGRHGDIRRVTRMGLWLSAGYGVLVLPVFLVSGPVFAALGQEAETAAIAARYLSVQGPAILPALLLMVMRAYLSGLGRTRAQFWSMLGAVAVNALVNYVLIFGNWGAPELGVLGAAIASLASTAVAGGVLAWYAGWVTPEHAVFTRLWRPDWEALRRVFSLGWPIGLATLAEAGLFSASSVMIGWLGPVPLAAHGIAIQIISVIFMVHLGLSQAATIRSGNAMGRDDGPGLRRGALAAFAASGVVAVVTVGLLLGLPDLLIGAFLGADDPARAEVLALGRSFLMAAAVFQLVDAAQVMAMGLLRGLQDTRGPMWLASVSYWLIGIPAAWVFGFWMEGGGVGVWLGMAAGLTVAAVTLQWRFWTRGVASVA